MYTVIGGIHSRAFRVLWALEELGLSYTHLAAAPHSPEVLEHAPSGKIPVLVDQGTTLHDSVAIMTYLADKHQGLTAPAGTLARGQQDAMTMWLIDEFDSQLWMAAKHSFVLPEDQRVAEIKPFLKGYFARQVDVFAQRLQGPFVMGDKITVPDILAVHCLNWAISAKFSYENDVVDAYVKRLRSRDAFRAVRALSAG